MLRTPLRFTPIFRQYLWGGRRLQTVLGKSIGSGDNYAESWEIVDHGQDQSRVTAGPWCGKSLHELLREQGPSLLGRDFDSWSSAPRPSGLAHRFPLLFKFLDCQRALSVQVHPNDEQGQLQTPPDLGKTEAWVVLEADPGSKVYAGLKAGVRKVDLAEAVSVGRTEEVLHSFEPQPGDCIFIPAGTVHALGSGLVIAEIQQASDTTFRLFDWNRVDATGQSRPLHIQESLQVIDEAAGPVESMVPIPDGPDAETLVQCDKFLLKRRNLSSAASLGGDDRMRILAVINGSLMIRSDTSEDLLARGETTLLPASAGELHVSPQTPKATFLEITLN
jgi:mannose-6-phosphate isomerase